MQRGLLHVICIGCRIWQGCNNSLVHFMYRDVTAATNPRQSVLLEAEAD